MGRTDWAIWRGEAWLDIARLACEATVQAHVDGGVPCMRLSFGGRDAYSAGELLYFFELACALSGYMSGINPFDQPGVEAYKTNMSACLASRVTRMWEKVLNKR